jgi:hypothetical protein
VNRSDLAARLRRDTDPAVARYIAWAESRGRGVELRLIQPFVDAGLVEINGDEIRLTPEGHDAARAPLATCPDHSRPARHRWSREVTA